ncbi:MAG TPA: alpha/beta hydrolase-fold protein [Bryobacteraceae bacterium]|nr:alpha/beta hydrolase-fold protein [Bryobacteraceae bacterium]
MQPSNAVRLLSAFCLAMAWPLAAQPQPVTTFAPVVKGMVLADVECTEFHSRFTGQDYHVYVSLPAGYRQGDQRYPVLYVPDLDEAFLLARGVTFFMNLRRRTGADLLEDFILVGVPLKSDGLVDWSRKRAFDLTPTGISALNAAYSRLLGGEVRTGGAPLFLRALKEELIPFIESKYRVTPDRGLAGHSFGGLFAAYVWLNDGAAFSRYLVSSPTLSWDNSMLLKAEAAVAQSGQSLHGRVFLSIGGDEADEIGVFKGMVAAIARHAYPNLQFESRIFEGENHLSVIPAAISQGLNFLYARSRPQ